MHQDRRPGWYPDPRRGERFRYWDDHGWHGVTSSTPVWGRVGPRGPGEGRRWPIVASVGAVVVLLLAGAGWWVASRGSDDTGRAAPPATVAPLVSVSPSSDCEITGAEFAAALDTPEARPQIDGQYFDDVRCTHNFATARTDGGLIAVVRHDPSRWVLVALGDDSPCLELELPSDITTALAC